MATATFRTQCLCPPPPGQSSKLELAAAADGAGTGAKPAAAEYQGVLNLVFVVLAYYIITSMMSNYQERGSLLRDRGLRMWRMMTAFPELAAAVVAIYFFSYTSFLAQLAVVKGYVRQPRNIHTLHMTLQVVLLTVVFFTGLHPATAHWPMSQKAALLIQTMVTLMKMHSYGVTNLQLHESKAIDSVGDTSKFHLVQEYWSAPPSPVAASTAAETPTNVTATDVAAKLDDSRSRSRSRSRSQVRQRTNGGGRGRSPSPAPRPPPLAVPQANKEDTEGQQLSFLKPFKRYPDNVTLLDYLMFTVRLERLCLGFP